MRRDLEKLKHLNFDLLVVGGGINGAAIAHLAALRGLKTALIEKYDFASGTSSKSSKLMHGGIRYLEKFHFSLVHEALRERFFHVQTTPHLVQPLPFIVPVYKGDKRPLWIMKLGVLLYDLMAGKHRVGKHVFLNRAEVLKRESGLSQEGLLGGVLYYDALMDDSRLCLENVLSADTCGAVCANYAEVTGFIRENGRVAGVLVRDNAPGQEASKPFPVHARRVVCAGGAWTNHLLKLDNVHAEERIRPTKGVHLVTAEKISEHALLIPARRDDRIFFVIPWKGGSLIGTTDTDFTGDPDRVEASESDLNYLLEETRRVFPRLRISTQNAEISFAGLRPLLKQKGSASSVSREHEIFETSSGLFFVAGGKYTTYRSIAEDFVNRLMSGPSIEKLYGSGNRDSSEALSSRFNVDQEIAAYLISKYGSRAANVLEYVKKEPLLGKRLSPEHPAIEAQIKYSVEVEMACRAEDIVFRRLTLGYAPKELQRVGKAMNDRLKELGIK